MGCGHVRPERPHLRSGVGHRDRLRGSIVHLDANGISGQIESSDILYRTIAFTIPEGSNWRARVGDAVEFWLEESWHN